MKKLSLGIAMLAITSTSAWAATSADLAVAGTIAPIACTPTFSAGGKIDYGTIATADVSLADYTTLAAKQLELAITCAAPAKIAFRIVAGRPGTVVASGPENGGFAVAPVPLVGAVPQSSAATGLGLDGKGNKIGGMAMDIKPGNTTVDGATNFDLIVGRPGAYKKKPQTEALRPDTYTVAKETTLNPEAFTTLVSQMDVQAYINKGSELDLTGAISLDGLVTFELNYL